MDHAVFSRLRSELIACSFKDLKLGPTVVDERFEENLFCQFFKGLASAIMTGQAREGDEGDYESDDASATTGSSEEEQPEVHSEAALQEFIGIIIKVIGPSIGPHWYMQVSVSPYNHRSLAFINLTIVTRREWALIFGWGTTLLLALPKGH